MILILVSFESKKDAEKAANYLIDNKLAACVEFFPVQSFYYWEGEKVQAQEFSGIIKTENGYFPKIKEALKEILSYETPQIIEVKTGNVDEFYLKWVKKSLK